MSKKKEKLKRRQRLVLLNQGTVREVDENVDCHDDRCAKRKGYECNCSMAVFIRKQGAPAVAAAKERLRISLLGRLRVRA